MCEMRHVQSPRPGESRRSVGDRSCTNSSTVRRIFFEVGGLWHARWGGLKRTVSFMRSDANAPRDAMEGSDELLSRISRSCAKNKVCGDVILDRVFRTAYDMVCARGYTVTMRCANSADIVEHIGSATPIVRGVNAASEPIHVFIASDDKVGIKQMRALKQRYESGTLILISTEGPTPFTRKELITEDPLGRVQFFCMAELMNNITRHHLVPEHRKLEQVEVDAVLQRFCMKPEQFPLLLMNDPVRRYYDFAKGDVIRIRRRGVGMEEMVYYRIVA